MKAPETTGFLHHLSIQIRSRAQTAFGYAGGVLEEVAEGRSRERALPSTGDGP